MTGFGKTDADIPGKKISVEIRTLNSKQADINVKMPWLYKEKEIEIRNMLSKTLERGKVDFSVYVDNMGDKSVPVINKEVVKNYYTQLSDVAGELYIDSKEQLLSVIMRLPETLKSVKEQLKEEEWIILRDLTQDALGMVDQYRIDEGKALFSDISIRIQNIENLLDEISPFEEDRIVTIKEKILSAQKQLGADEIDMNRFEQEMIYYLEKLDLNEEKVRLKKHCEYFTETAASPDTNGKKLGFITQEIGREINTIGSKANNASIQKIVVRMKDELEKVKEQVLNIL
jgi:uncharacterized protein (TIGR00255 family)